MNIYSDYKKITLTGTETEIKFRRNYPVFGVKGENITVALTAGAVSNTRSTADTDGVVMWAHKENIDTMYLTGTGDVIVWAGDRAEECPFKTGGKGGGGGSGGGCTYRGTTTTAISNGSTTNPITIDGESYTAVFGDVVVYNYTEFVFDGTQWSEFGRPFDTTPTSGSANAVTSDGIYLNTAGKKYYVDNDYKGEVFNNYVNNVASGTYSHAEGNNTTASGSVAHAEGNHTTASGGSSHASGYYTIASGHSSHAGGYSTIASKTASTAIGKYNVADTDVEHLFIVGNGTSASSRSNILEVSATDVNINGDIQKNGVSLPTPYTTMPVITSNMLGQIAQYVGTTGADFTKGYFYIASSDGAAEPTYSWVHLPTQNGYSETVLYTASSPHTNNIELSQAYTNFDDIVIVWKYSSPDPDTVDNYSVRYTKTYKVSTFGDGVVFLCGEDTTAEQAFTAYTLGDITHINYNSKVGTLYNWIAKVIGIKY